jgi:type IV secretion system protein VirB9
MKKLLLAVALAAAFPIVAQAEISPQRGAYDARVRVVDYNPANVVRLTTFYGVSTHIQFGDGEIIKDIATGDDQAWALVPRSGNHLFIKPRATNADTNLTVITNKRVYQFALMVRDSDRKNQEAWRDPNLVFSLSFRYPDEELAKQQALAKAEQQQAIKRDVQSRLETAKSEVRNYDYWLAGALEVSPTEVHDNGRFTRLIFGNNRDMPAIYAVDSEGEESLINANVEGNAIVVHRVYRKLILRKGNYVACLVNKSFDFDKGRDNTSGTVAPDVQRVLKESK